MSSHVLGLTLIFQIFFQKDQYYIQVLDEDHLLIKNFIINDSTLSLTTIPILDDKKIIHKLHIQVDLFQRSFINFFFFVDDTNFYEFSLHGRKLI